MRKLKFDEKTKELIEMCCTESEAACKMNSINRLAQAVDEIIGEVTELQNKEVYDAAFGLGTAIKKHIDIDRYRTAESTLVAKLNRMLAGKIVARDDTEGMFTVIHVQECRLSCRRVVFDGDVIELDTSFIRPSMSVSLVAQMSYSRGEEYYLLTEKELNKFITGIRNNIDKYLKVFGR